jgi:bacillithiol system protein YtxJ
MNKSMKWIPLTTEDHLREIIEESYRRPVVIFKHSTRCGISSMAKSRLESKWDISIAELPFYYLDLLRYRDISDRIANDLNVRHESPQVLLVSKGKCFYHASHSGIDVSAIKAALKDQ